MEDSAILKGAASDMVVYCAVENDDLEHICFMEDSMPKLSKTMGIPLSSLWTCCSRGLPCHGYKIVRVETTEED